MQTSVVIVVGDHSMLISYKELSAMVGALNIMHDILRMDMAAFVSDDHALLETTERHRMDFADTITHFELDVLLHRLFDFYTDHLEGK